MNLEPVEGLAPVAPVVRQRLADQAYEVLRAGILARRYEAGDRLSVPRLAAELGLSRSPVREAVQRLVSEGLVSEQAHRGAVVAGLDSDELGHVYAVRELLEGLAAREAAGLGDRTSLVTDLEQILAEHHAAADSGAEPAVIHADVRFHERLLAAAGNPALEAALRPIRGRVQLAMLAGDLRSWAVAALDEHRRIVSAVSAGDVEAAESAARQHVRQVRERLEGHLRDE